MKNTAVLAFAALLALATLPAAAQQPSGKIGFVDTNMVMRDSQASRNAQKELETEFKKREAEILKLPANQQERRRQALSEDMSARRDEALKRLVDRANAEIKRIAEAENFDAVFFEAAYAAPRIDLTPRIIKALDAKK